MDCISVVLPVLNAQATIGVAVDSILQQTHGDLELIVVDDGSTDKTRDVLQAFSDSRLRIISTRHRGVSDAANLGTQHAAHDFIARMDADDVAHPQRLELQLQLLQSEGLDVVGSQVQIVNGDLSETSTLRRYMRWINDETGTSDEILALRFVEFPLVNPTILARRAYFELGFVNNDLPEDYDLMLRAAAAGMSFGKVNQPLLLWVDSAARLTRNCGRYSASAFMNCRRRYFENGPLAGVSQVDLMGVGATGKDWMRWLQHKGIHIRRAYDVSPRRIGERIHGVEVCCPSELTPPDGNLLVMAVGSDGARQQLSSLITPLGYRSGHDAWFVA